MKKEGHRGVEILQTQGVAVLQGGQEISVFEMRSLGFILLTWWCLCCSVGFPEGLITGELGVSRVSRRCLALSFIKHLDSSIREDK